MIHEKGQNWNDYPAMQKRGRFVFKQEVDMETEFKGKEFMQNSYKRNVWTTASCPTFTKDQEFLLSFIPNIDNV
jgi:tRNA(His) 5'-end guanylyltransferase